MDKEIELKRVAIDLQYLSDLIIENLPEIKDSSGFGLDHLLLKIFRDLSPRISEIETMINEILRGKDNE